VRTVLALLAALPTLPALLGAALALAGLACAPAWAAKADYTQVAKGLEAEIRRDMNRNDVKGLCIAVVDDQRILWAQAYGWADEAGGVPADLNTVFRVGSISKVVTSARVMQLAEAGLVDIDADIRAYVPEFAIRSRFAPAKPITARMLMSHHSGLPTDVVAGMWSAAPQSLAEFIPTLAREDMAAPPATQWRYSNVGFSLLGRMVERVAGQPFAQAMRDGLLLPLGMENSGYVLDEALARRVSAGYAGGLETPSPTLRDMPTGSLYSTAPDMAAFIKAMLAEGGGVLSTRSVREMATPQFPGLPLDFDFQMGLGFMLSGLHLADGSRLIWHSGTALPFQAFMALEPNRRIGVVALANTQEASAFLSELALKALEQTLAAKGAAPARPAPGGRVFRPEPLKPERLSPEELATYTGDYAAEGGLLSTIRLVNGALKATIEGKDAELTPARGGLLRLQSGHSLPFPPRTGLGEYLEHLHPDGLDVLVLRGRARPFPLVKLAEKPIPKAWLDRLGVYAPEQPCGTGLCYKALALTVQDGQLMAVLGVSLWGEGSDTMPAVCPLTPLGEDEAVVAGLGAGTGAMLRAVEGGLYHSGYTFRRMP